MIRALPILLTVVVACSTESSPEGAEQDERSASEKAGGKVGVGCTALADLDEPPRAALREAATTVFDHLRAGQTDPIWEALHPQAQRPDQREAFTKALEAMNHRLAGNAEKPEVELGYFVDVRGGVTDLARVRCGEDKDPSALTLLTNAGNEDLAVVVLRSQKKPFGFATTVQLRKYRGGWRLLGVHVGLASYRGFDAADFEARADAYVKQQRVVEAYLSLAVAQELANRGGAVKLDRALELADKVQAVADSREYQQHLGVWEVGARRFDVQGFSVAATASDLSAVVRYVSTGGLVQDVLDSEADALLGYVKMQHPELAKRFDAVIFEAYESAPDPNKAGEKLEAYRTVRRF